MARINDGNGSWGQSGAKNRVDAFYHGLMQPDLILPSQYFARSTNRSEIDGELKLMLAVLRDGINCFLNGRLLDPKGFLEAQEWIRDRNLVGPFSFDNVCEALGIAPQPLRKRLEVLSLLRQQTGASAKWPVYFSNLNRRPKVVRSRRITPSRQAEYSAFA